jgi:transcription initiation factor TFIIB
VKLITSKDIYKNAFNDDIQVDSNANPCPESGRHVTPNSVETLYEDWNRARIPTDRQGSRVAIFEDDETNLERTGAPLTPTRHDRGLSTEIGYNTDGSGNTFSG